MISCNQRILLLGVFGAALWLAISQSAMSADRVWAERPVSAVQVGLLPDKSTPRYRVVTVGVLAPETLFDANFKYCSNQALNSATAQVRQELLQSPGYETIVTDLANAGTAVSLETLNSQRDARSLRIATIMSGATTKVHAAMIPCLGDRAKKINKQIKVAFAFRECPAESDICTWSAKSNASPQRDPAVFERIYSWASVTQPRKANTWLMIANDSKVMEMATNDVRETVAWAAAIPAAQALEEFEQYVAYARKSAGVTLSYVVPSILELRRETALRVIDELRAPFSALSRLPSGRDELKLLSDELGRTRLRDCAQLRGKFDAKSIGDCAGFQISEPEIFACLSGARCLPALAAQANVSLLKLDVPMNLSDLLNKTQLPRVGIEIPYPEWIDVARSCTAKATSELKNDCLLKGTMSPADYAMVACVKDSAGVGKPDALLGCAEQLASGSQKALVGCIRAADSHPDSLAYCAAKQNVPVNLRPAVECIEEKNGTENIVACIGASSLGSDGQRALECYQAHSDSPKAAVLCSVTGSLPKDAQDVIGCVQEHPGSWQGAGACMAAKKLALSGDLGKVVACGLSSGGSVVGTVACAAGSGLRPEQAIILQCAATASTGPGFALCTGGLLAFNEFNQCKGKDVGEGNCFGKNNEIRRFVRALGLPDIGPNSLAAQVANVYLDVLKSQVAFYEDAIELAGDVLKDGVKVFGKAVEVVEDAVKAVEHAGKNVVRCVTKPWKC